VPLSEEFDQLTLECWARGRSPREWRGIVSKLQSSGFGLTVVNGRITGNVMIEGIDGYVQPKSTTTFDENVWTHCALVWDGMVARLFINGQPEGESYAAGELVDNRLPLFVGADTDGYGNPQSALLGEVDEVRLSRVARYTEAFEPSLHHEPDDDTVLLLHFDRAFGDIAGPGVHPDASGRDHHGWPVGSARLVESDL